MLAEAIKDINYKVQSDIHFYSFRVVALTKRIKMKNAGIVLLLLKN